MKRLKRCGFQFDRQAAGSHEIWYREVDQRYTNFLNHPGDLPKRSRSVAVWLRICNPILLALSSASNVNEWQDCREQAGAGSLL